MKVIHKPWGKEEWLELNDKYCYKRIYINAGYKTSFQYHLQKQETNFIISGTAEVWLENDKGEIEKTIMNAGEYFNVTPPKKHRVIAITDIILQEVSTPEVDDVIRIEDDTNRKDGKLEAEHQTPAVLILAAGIGSRLGNLTKNINKALLPINNKAIISYIINLFPKEYEIVMTLGYKGESLQEYCQIVHSDRKFKFVDIDDFSRGPGYSALKCKEFLQRPFYLSTADCILMSKLPHLDGNWLGVSPTGFPEKYSTVDFDEKGNIQEFLNKGEDGFDHAFIGVAAIWNYEVFWNELQGDEVVSAFCAVKKYPSFKAKQLEWLDTGNLDDLKRAKEHFGDKPLSLYKETSEITYKDKGKFIKFCNDPKIIENKVARANHLVNKIPVGFGSTKHFTYYYWEEGKTLYELDTFRIFKKFINQLDFQNTQGNDTKLLKSFYIDKTINRRDSFIQKYGKHYYDSKFRINDSAFPSLKEIFEGINLERHLCTFDNTFYPMFHGDLQFDNIIYNPTTEKFSYIDWRESFAGNTEVGDLYYDLAKLYAGCLIPFNEMKDDKNIRLFESSDKVSFNVHLSPDINRFRLDYVEWMGEKGYDLDKVDLITALIFLNMSPLHSEKFGKLLWFKAIEMLYAHR